MFHCIWSISGLNFCTAQGPHPQRVGGTWERVAGVGIGLVPPSRGARGAPARGDDVQLCLSPREAGPGF